MKGVVKSEGNGRAIQNPLPESADRSIELWASGRFGLLAVLSFLHIFRVPLNSQLTG